jgi:hypothetical protein
LNDLNRYLLNFHEQHSKRSDQEEIIEIFDQGKSMDPEYNEVMVNINIDAFEMSYEEYVSYFEHLGNLEKVSHLIQT